jgi:uncharacterized membrane protein
MWTEVEIPLWLLAISYWIHLLATITWLGGLLIMAVVAWPAVRSQLLDAGQWTELLRRFTPWANISLVLLWATGFLQLSADVNYEGFLKVNSLWSQAILVKHIAVGGMMAFGLYIQLRLHPALSRLAILEQKQPDLAQAERERLTQRQNRLLRLNLFCAVMVLLFTAIATAV